ncbi:unnamed protein product [Lactuca saligna]|uniref:Uncharacterized protein n=1 Tax=Lactuca saligna TaxID=75948 RepID=A0AA35Z688_LACSI|nr:unnamed protein product [Lactuca saligna]
MHWSLAIEALRLEWEESGIVVVNKVSWKAVVCSPAVWFTSGGNVCAKENLLPVALAKGIGSSIVGLQSSHIEVLIIVGPPDCVALVTTVVDLMQCGDGSDALF